MVGKSKGTALRRFEQIERRLEKDASLRKHYDDFMQEYIDLGHMKIVGSADEVPEAVGTVCYLPHLQRIQHNDEELHKAKEALAKGVPQNEFAQELKDLKLSKTVSHQSTLKLLRPFLDENGVIRLWGRIQHSNENYHTNYPIALPSKHPLSRLIAVHFHTQNFHAGPRMTLYAIRQEFWPVRGRDLVNVVCHNCFCHHPVPATPPQGQLPKAQTVSSSPFATSDVDYCGPVYLKPTHRRAASRKVFIAVFVCFVTKAVHLELVCDLSTDTFIAAFRRFIARREMPDEIYSDNGKKFQGAKNKISEMYDMINNQRNKEIITDECSHRGIVWRFIPPKAPNFGGLWEAAVKTAKSSLLKTIGGTQLSFEDFAIVLTQIEENMNSRPLTPLSEDPTELDVLTPGHFHI
ncbi:uncharacterized protein LOC131680077 [Topomyia yanbarensis]|uniref:uncharacterized protein LOC131680077 n=1 Tax=Topomyia yanbarensis TaxID=2498891 RepID=UPI00273B5ECC|nr:uncharacterized protein LOC131680077 [Topomyia yanbarensis]